MHCRPPVRLHHSGGRLYRADSRGWIVPVEVAGGKWTRRPRPAGWFEPHIGLAEAASVIRNYEVQFVPGQLQTADYARAVIQLAIRTPPGRRPSAAPRCG